MNNFSRTNPTCTSRIDAWIRWEELFARSRSKNIISLSQQNEFCRTRREIVACCTLLRVNNRAASWLRMWLDCKQAVWKSPQEHLLSIPVNRDMKYTGRGWTFTYNISAPVLKQNHFSYLGYILGNTFAAGQGDHIPRFHHGVFHSGCQALDHPHRLSRLRLKAIRFPLLACILMCYFYSHALFLSRGTIN